VRRQQVLTRRDRLVPLSNRQVDEELEPQQIRIAGVVPYRFLDDRDRRTRVALGQVVHDLRLKRNVRRIQRQQRRVRLDRAGAVLTTCVCARRVEQRQTARGVDLQDLL